MREAGHFTPHIDRVPSGQGQDSVWGADANEMSFGLAGEREREKEREREREREGADRCTPFLNQR